MGKVRHFQVRTFSIIAALLMVFSLIAPVAANAEASNTTAENKISSSLLKQFSNEKEISFIVKFKESANPNQVAQEAKKQAAKAKLSAADAELSQRKAVVNALQTTADKSQENVKSFLEDEGVEEVKSFFSVNAMAVTATEEVAKEIAQYAEVAEVVTDDKHELNQPIDTKELAAPGSYTWNVDRVNAPGAWAKGIDGSGVTVATFDSGVQWDHVALKESYRGYNADTGEVNHADNYLDATAGNPEPTDGVGHGTHVTGTMVGYSQEDDGAFGVAPGAEWMAVKVFDDTGSTSDSILLAGGDWILAPNGDASNAPDVVNNSWGGQPGYMGKDEFFRDMVIAWRAAGIFPTFAAGNETPLIDVIEGSVTAPANYPESFAVGATDDQNKLAAFSLRGPSPYGEVKPDIAAPGVAIPSTYPGDRYAEMNGTSMAAPAVSGVVALMLQANPNATIDELEQVMMDTATALTDDEYTESPNNGYGHGLVNALAAVEAIAEVEPDPEPDPEPEPEPDPEPVPTEIDRLFGDLRYDTAIEISQKGWADGSLEGETVIVARGDDFADALAGVPLAHAWNTPILLTPSNKVLDKTVDEIARLGAKEVRVLGGDIAVSDNVVKKLEKSGLTVNRIEGDTRIETAVEIAKAIAPEGVDKAVVANGYNFPDALSVASFAAQEGLPILLTQDTKLPEATKEALASLGTTNTIVVGGDQVVSEDIAAELPESKRLAGNDRYDTNLAILQEFGVDKDTMYVATGKEYPDALAGAVLAAKEGTAVVLVHDKVPENIASYLQEKGLSGLTIFGGPVAITDVVKGALEDILNK